MKLESEPGLKTQKSFTRKMTDTEGNIVERDVTKEEQEMFDKA
jgi:hypothetical protein